MVDIKESSVYYHFKNKRDIFDELLLRFEAIAADLMGRLEEGLSTPPDTYEGDLFEKTCDCF